MSMYFFKDLNQDCETYILYLAKQIVEYLPWAITLDPYFKVYPDAFHHVSTQILSPTDLMVITECNV